jgi:hydroxypyruvate isomerase
MAAEMIRLIDSDKLRILYDVYHMQLNEGSLIDTITEYIDTIGHMHIADAPGRHEPGTGEINYANIMKQLTKLNYSGIVGSELFPEHDTATAVKAIMSIF